jgi:PAS domain S-box-containing protein
MTTPPDDQQAPGPPHSPGAPRDGAPGSSGLPTGPQPRVAATPQDALARLLDRRATVDGAHAEPLLRALVDAAPLAMWVLDPDGRVVLWNPAVARLTGWTADEALGKFSPIVPPEGVEEFRKLFAQALRKEPVVDAEVRRRKKDGSSINLSLSSAAILAPDGAVVAVLVMAADLTARKEAEETARRLASERAALEAADVGRGQLAGIVESISDGYAAFDREWRYTYINRRYAALIRQNAKDPDTLIGRVVWEAFPEIVGTKFHAEALRAVSDGQPVEFDEYYAPLDQTFNVRVFPTPDGIVSITRDVSERRRAERALEESESRFRSLVEASSQIVWTTDAEGRIVTPTPEWIALTGQALTDVQGYGMLGAVHPDERDEVGRLWHDAIANKRPFTATFRLRVASGSYRWFAARGVPVFNEDGSVREWVGTSTDIHERKSAEAALGESEARFRNMADSVPVMLWMTEPDGSCSFLNREWYAFTGQTPETALGAGWIGALHPDDHTTVGDLFLAANAKRELYRAEYRIRRADGEYRWAIGSATPRFGPDGEYRGYVGSSIDITERRRTEDALRESERRHRRIFDTVEVSIWEEDFSAVKEAIDKLKAEGVTDIRRYVAEHPDFVARAASLVRVRDVNEASLAMFGGRDKSELLASLDRVFVPETLDVFAEEIAAIFEGRTRLQSETPGRTLAGQPLELAFSIAFPPDDPQLQSVLVSMLDITDRKRVEAERERLLGAERAARERIEQLQSVTAALVEAVTVEDVADRVVETVRATTTSRSATLALLTSDGSEFEVIRMLGLPEEAAAKWQRYPADPGFPTTHAVRTGEPVFLRSIDEILERFPKLEDRAREYAFAATAVLPLVVAGKTVGTLGLNYATPQPFDAGKRAYLAAVAQQCAQALERARLYEAERAARAEAESTRRDADAARTAAEQASRAKSDFLATMSHELRTPLNAIIGYQNLLADGVTGPVSDVQHRQLDRIGASAHHLLMLIDEVLTLSRVEAGKESIHIEPVDISRVLDEAGSIIEPLAKQKSLEFRVIEPESPIVLQSDAGKLRQAVLNLLSNAVKFTGRGSVTLHAFDAGDDVVFEVRDTGIGIAAEHLARIFEPFWQVEASTTRTAPGTGLGLAVTRRLAHLLGGEVSVQSAVGEGSTFTLRLRRKPPQP